MECEVEIIALDKNLKGANNVYTNHYSLLFGEELVNLFITLGLDSCELELTDLDKKGISNEFGIQEKLLEAITRFNLKKMKLWAMVLQQGSIYMLIYQKCHLLQK